MLLLTRGYEFVIQYLVGSLVSFQAEGILIVELFFPEV
jgi:hypothetical protein